MRQFGHTDFCTAFTPGTLFQLPGFGRVRVHQVEIGDLVLPSGKIVACDPMFLWDDLRVPLFRTVPTGKYPVMLSMVASAEEDAVNLRWVACAMVRFTTAKPAVWEMAVLPDQDPATLPVGQFFGYGVDAGLGCFIDQATVHDLAKEDGDKFWDDRVLDVLHPPGATSRDWANIVVDQKSGSNLVVFTSGYGDGGYASYWGIGGAGELCCLVTDFAVLVEHLEGQATFLIREWLERAVIHSDLSRIGLTVRLLTLADPGPPRTRVGMDGDITFVQLGEHRLRVEMEGAGQCEALIVSGGKEYSSHRTGCRVSGGVARYDFEFEEPLHPDAQITLKYGMGMQALEPVA